MAGKRVMQREQKGQAPSTRERDSDQVGRVREFYTVGQLAELLQLTEMTIYRMINRAELPCYAIGRVKRFRHSDIEEFLAGCRIPAAKPVDPPDQTEQRVKASAGGGIRTSSSRPGRAAKQRPSNDLGDD